MAMVFQFETIFVRNAALRGLDLRVLELRHLLTLATDQVIMVGFGTPAFIIGIPACAKTLCHDSRFKKHGKIPVNRIPGDLEPLSFETGNKNVHVEMSALTLDPLDQFEPLAGQTTPFAADKTFEFFLIFNHRGRPSY